MRAVFCLVTCLSLLGCADNMYTAKAGQNIKPTDFVPVDQIVISKRNATVVLNKNNFSKAYRSCVPQITRKFSYEDMKVGEVGLLGHKATSRVFVYDKEKGICVRFSENRYPIFAAEMLDKTVQPNGVPKLKLGEWNSQIALDLAKNGSARVAYIMGNGNAVIANYWAQKTSNKPNLNNVAIHYDSTFKKAGQWESTRLDHRFKHPNLEGYELVKRGKNKKMIKSTPLVR